MANLAWSAKWLDTKATWKATCTNKIKMIEVNREDTIVTSALAHLHFYCNIVVPFWYKRKTREKHAEHRHVVVVTDWSNRTQPNTLVWLCQQEMNMHEPCPPRLAALVILRVFARSPIIGGDVLLTRRWCKQEGPLLQDEWRAATLKIAPNIAAPNIRPSQNAQASPVKPFPTNSNDILCSEEMLSLDAG